jgi:hypothetical protein
VATHERKPRGNLGRSWLPELLRHEWVARVWRQNPISRAFTFTQFCYNATMNTHFESPAYLEAVLQQIAARVWRIEI